MMGITMKRIIFIPLALMVLLVASCTIDASDNGDLDGYWHLERVDTIATGGVRNLSDTTVFWSVEHKLIELRDTGALFFFRFGQTADSLTLHSPYINYLDQNVSGQGSDYPLDSASRLGVFGIEGLEVHYKKESLSSSRMVLRSQKLRLHFRKF